MRTAGAFSSARAISLHLLKRNYRHYKHVQQCAAGCHLAASCARGIRGPKQPSLVVYRSLNCESEVARAIRPAKPKGRAYKYDESTRMLSPQASNSWPAWRCAVRKACKYQLRRGLIISKPGKESRGIGLDVVANFFIVVYLLPQRRSTDKFRARNLVAVTATQNA